LRSLQHGLCLRARLRSRDRDLPGHHGPEAPDGRVTGMQRLKWPILYTLLLAYTVFSVFPFVFALLTSFKDPSQTFSPGLWPSPFSFQNYHELLTTTPLFLRWVLNSLLIAG